jgi:hypothetical protein
MLAKVLAVIAAVFLVGSVAVGMLGPQDLTLGQALMMIDKFRMASMETFVRVHLSDWMWDKPAMALLVRPIWMLPAAIGLIVAGGAMTAASTGKPTPSRRRRS